MASYNDTTPDLIAAQTSTAGGRNLKRFKRRGFAS